MLSKFEDEVTFWMSRGWEPTGTISISTNEWMCEVTLALKRPFNFDMSSDDTLIRT